MANILIVDDEAPIRTLLMKVLNRNGHSCVCAASAAEAIRWLRQGSPVELALCDVRMPGESGLDLAMQIRHERPDVAVVMVSGVDDSQTMRVSIESGAYGYLLKPFRTASLLITVMNAIRRREAEQENRQHRERLEELVNQRTFDLRRTMGLLETANDHLRAAQEEVIQRLSIASEVRDEETGAHIVRMSRYSALVAEEYGLRADRVELIRIASPLHDVGKIGIPDRILLKPGRHTVEEFEEMKQHTVMGYRTLAGTDLPVLNMAASIAYTHHEKFDGSGYPRGLAGQDIPIEGRIVAVADVFDALMSRRVYKPAFSVEKSVGIIQEGAGRHFDPKIVACFIARFDEILSFHRAHADTNTDPGTDANTTAGAGANTGAQDANAGSAANAKETKRRADAGFSPGLAAPTIHIAG